MESNVLIIANKPPYPSIDGGCYAMGKFEKLMRNTGSNIFYFAISTPKHPFLENELPKEWILNENFFTEHIDTTIKNKHVLKYFAGSSIRAVRFYSSNVKNNILKLIAEKNIDTVIFESIYSAVYLPSIKKSTTVRTYLRAHNIEHKIWENFYNGMPRGLKKLAYKSETARLKVFEDMCFESVTGNIFISAEDQQYLVNELKLSNSIVLPIQMEVIDQVKRNPASPLQLFHIGAMDWLPNLEGVELFLQNIFPGLLNKFPSIQLHLAGKSMPDYFKKYASDHITIHGEVANSQSFVAKYDVLVVPILSGSGIRIKILEAMAAGKPVVSTTAGIKGIKAAAGKDYLLANSLNEWIKAIDELNNLTQYTSLVNNGVSYIRENYSGSALLENLKTFLKNGQS